jgi:hypothetical protein
MHGQADARARHSAALFETVAAMYISTMGLVCASGRALHTWVVLLLEGSESLLHCFHAQNSILPNSNYQRKSSREETGKAQSIVSVIEYVFFI